MALAATGSYVSSDEIWSHAVFMMLNPLSETHATRAAIAQAIWALRDALWRIRP